MSIANIQDAQEVERSLQSILAAPDINARIQTVRTLFVEILDYYPADQRVSLGPASNDQLPYDSYVVARRDGVSAVYVPLDDTTTNRITGATAAAAAKVIGNALADEPLLLFTNRDGDQLHIIRPDLVGSRPRLQRIVAHRDQHQRTVVQQIANMWDDYGNRGKTISDAIAHAFSVEPVTKEFFETYRKIFEYAKASISGFGGGEADQEDRHLFTQTLFNRLMFVYFLSRKGWLKFKGDTDYLKALWHDHQLLPSHGNCYTTRLRPLFFSGLNEPNPMDLTQGLATLIGEVPFLNGGLFEETDLDKREGITVPDETIEQVLIGLFDRFNFTVMESTPFDVEVAVDPEMLGKVFEELVTGRHDSGAYYTPRPVVSFMCREALKGYLEGQETGVDADAIEKFVDRQDPSSLNLAAARRISEALSEVTAVDPACGSGAYLLGMMQELIELQTTLYNVGVDSKAVYELKLEIIQRNLYGVDIDEFAVNIAMLRMWLSLAIDFEGESPPPLPNLDFKVLCGDSLPGPNPSAGVEVQGTLGQDVGQFRRLGQLKADYMRASLGPDKDRLKGQIGDLNEEIRQALGVSVIDGVVDWRVEFAEVFAQRGGFDIAIANPPYVRQENIGENKATIAQQYTDAVTPRSDLYCYFYARALQLLRDGGMHVFVCSNSWLDVGYGARLQEYLLNNAHIRSVYESAVERQFSTADINTVVSLISKTPTNEKETRFVSLRAEFDAALADPGLRREIVRSRAALRAGGADGAKFVGDKWGGKYLRAPDIYHYILEKRGGRLVRLGDIATVRRGITTGANDFFYLTPQTVAQWGIEPEYCRPVMTTPQESRSIAVNVATLPKRLFMCHQDKGALAGTGALRYIEWGEAQGYHTRSSVASRRRWYDLGAIAMVPLVMNKMIDTTSRAFLIGDVFANNVLYEIASEKATPTKLCAALNSTVCQLIVNLEGRVNFGGGMLELAAYEIANIAIVNPELLPELDAAIFDSEDWDVLTPSAERWRIDGMVFDALGLTAGERIAVHEGVAELVGNRKRRAGSVLEAPQAGVGKGQSADAVSRSIVTRGKSIYEQKIRHKVEETERGNFVVIDIYSEDYEIDPAHAAASRRLVARNPGAMTYTVRIGYPTTYKTGLRSGVINS